MLARETGTPFSDGDWVFELKWDGFRAIAELDGHRVKLYSRNGNSFAAAYPIITEALSKLNLKAVIDGEIIVVDANGRSDFQKLQQYKSDPVHPLEFRVFDVLSINGKPLYDLPLLERKKRLKKLLPRKLSIIRYSDHIEEKGETLFALAKERDLEGIIAKKADSEYYPGVRTSEWLKIKYHKSTEAVIAGFTDPGGGRKYFGALLLGIYQNGKLRYIGHTGTGFNTKILSMIHAALKPLVQRVSPFDTVVKSRTPVTWVAPRLVAEIKYSEWTRDNILRHPVFIRLRNDKKPSEVTMANTKPTAKTARKKPAKKVAHPKKTSGKKSAPKKASKGGEFIAFGKIKVKVTNRTKVYWPKEGYTKGDVIDYYRSVSKFILPYLKNRPQSLLRSPNGIRDRGFFHKDAGDEAPEWVCSEPVYSPSANKMIDYIVCNNAATLAYMNNLGCIEINPWHSTIRALDKPDYLIIDIDPSVKNTFNEVIEAAQVVKEIFDRAGVPSYCKTSGASGLHVYVPAGKRYTYDQLKDFSQLICTLAQEQLPSFTTLERNLKKRGDRRIYMDYLQNRKGQTISSVYSLRPKPGATVSMPLEWKEVKAGLTPQDFHIRNALKRIGKKGDLFAGVLGKGLDLAKSLKRLEGK